MITSIDVNLKIFDDVIKVMTSHQRHNVLRLENFDGSRLFISLKVIWLNFILIRQFSAIL